MYVSTHKQRLKLSFLQANDKDSKRKFPSKSCPLRYGIAKIQEDAKKLFDYALRDFLGPHNSAWGITSLSISASKILDTPSVSLPNFILNVCQKFYDYKI